MVWKGDIQGRVCYRVDIKCYIGYDSMIEFYTGQGVL